MKCMYIYCKRCYDIWLIKSKGYRMREQDMSWQLEQDASKISKKKICLIIVVILVLLVSLCTVILIYFKQKQNKNRISYKSPEIIVSIFVQSVEQKDAGKIQELLSPEYIQYMKKEYGYNDDDFFSDIEYQIDFFHEYMTEEYEIGDFDGISYNDSDWELKTYSGDDLEEMKTFFREEYYMEVDGFAEADMDWHVKGSENEVTVYAECYMFQIGDNWFFLDWYWR